LPFRKSIFQKKLATCFNLLILIELGEPKGNKPLWFSTTQMDSGLIQLVVWLKVVTSRPAPGNQARNVSLYDYTIFR